MGRPKLPFVIIILFSLNMAQCQPKDYDEMLESLYSHTVPLIRIHELEAIFQKDSSIVLLDIRSREEFAVSHLPGAQLIDYDHFKKKNVENIDKEKPVIVYCSVGYRSEKVGEKLLRMGFKNVKNLYGGIFEWKNEGFGVVNSKGQKTDSVHTYNRSWSKWLKKGIKVY